MSVLINGKQASPCICAKAKMALSLAPERMPNKKSCTIEYWEKVLNYYAELHTLPSATVQKAKKRKDLYEG